MAVVSFSQKVFRGLIGAISDSLLSFLHENISAAEPGAGRLNSNDVFESQVEFVDVWSHKEVDKLWDKKRRSDQEPNRTMSAKIDFWTKYLVLLTVKL